MKVHHFSIEVSDLERSVSFYERFVGFVPEMRIQWENEQIAFLTLGPFRMEFVQPEEFIHTHTNTHIAFEVSDLTHLCECLLAEGLLVKEELILANGWKSVFVTGPDGELLEFIEVADG